MQKYFLKWLSLTSTKSGLTTRVIPDNCNKAQAKNGTKLLLVISLVLVTHSVQREICFALKMMNLNFESWFQFSDMYELIRFMYKYIWQVQKVQPQK